MDTNEIKNLPDYPFLRQVQKALWKIGEVRGAAVMIGAGFSRFAVLATDKTPLAPLWSDFQEAMLKELYPKRDNAPTDPLVLAEEYRAALGTNSLEGLIKSLVRNEEWNPGKLHESLLRLPWADVLTTNWDTLLEKAVAHNPDLSFDIVRVLSDIAWARAPRIVKLHGSLPSHRPFIFTHEDFRTYGDLFAPFVNLARQVLLENELCLLGFSGNDPNFLEWSGWVRDQLGPAARPIRLIGVLDISPSRRRFLEKLNVTPIDLAPLVRNVPEEHRQQYATELFLESLRKAKPRPKTEWKFTSKKTLAENTSSSDAQLANLAKAWAQDRKNYPGWLVVPHSIRIPLRDDFIDCEQFFKNSFGEASKSVKASALYEAVWRCETAFWALPEFMENAISDMVKRNEDDLLPLRQRCLLRSTIVRAARRRRDWSAFDERIKFLDHLHDSTAKVKALYERCLRALDELDYEFIETHVEDIAGRDPVWLLRRAALIAELGNSNAAAKLIYEALREIQPKRAQDRHSLWLLSREAWTFLLMPAARFLIEKQFFENQPDWPVDYKDADTDPWNELHFYDHEIREMEHWHRDAGIDKQLQFGAGAYRHLKLLGQTVACPRSDLIALAEHVGIPLRLGTMDFLGFRLARAVQIPYDDNSTGNPWASTRVLARGIDKGLTDNLFNSVAVARLPFETVSEIAGKLRSAIEFGKSKLTVRSSETEAQKLDRKNWTNRLALLIELLSRLSVRFRGDESIGLFRFGISLIDDLKIKDLVVFERLGNLLRRSLQALKPERRGEMAFDILNLPLPCEKEISGQGNTWFEVSDLLETATNFQAFKNTHERSARIEFLIKTSENISDKISRQYAIFRLLAFFKSNLLNEKEAEDFGNAVWQHTGSDGFPIHTNLLKYAYLELPGRSPDFVQGIFNASVVKKLVKGSFDEYSLRAILMASHPIRQEHKPYGLNPKDALMILDHALDWRQQPESLPSIFLENQEESVRLGGLIGNALASTVLPSITPDLIRKNQIRKFLDRISDGSLPELLIALPALVKLDETIEEEATNAIRKGLINKRPYIVKAALRAVSWFEEFARNENLPMPEVLVTETVSICLMRREPGLLSALNCARKLVKSKNVSKSELNKLLYALELLLEETNYKNQRDESRRSDIGVIRKAAVTFAATLKDAGIDEPVLDRWIAEAESDPMPEVRYALSDPTND